MLLFVISPLTFQIPYFGVISQLEKHMANMENDLAFWAECSPLT